MTPPAAGWGWGKATTTVTSPAAPGLLLKLLPGLDTTPWRAVPFLCLGVGCGLFGGGTGELLAVQAMKKHPELQKQNEIAERDERNVAIGNAAKAKGYDVMTFAFGAMLLFSVLMEADLALTLVMVAVYLFIQFYSLWCSPPTAPLPSTTATSGIWANSLLSQFY